MAPRSIDSAYETFEIRESKTGCTADSVNASGLLHTPYKHVLHICLLFLHIWKELPEHSKLQYCRVISTHVADIHQVY